MLWIWNIFWPFYCSTPFLKRKTKIFLQTVPFVPTPAAVFSAAGMVVIRRTFSARAGERGLESTAHFSTGCIVIGGTVRRGASFIQVVIRRTFPGDGGWNNPHSLRRAGLLSAAQFLRGAGCAAKIIGCYPAHNSDFSGGRWVVIHSTICAVGKIGYCYRRHNSDFGRVFLAGLSMSKPGCYPAHISKSVVVIERTVSNL